MDLKEKQSQLLSMLRREMNGAVAGSMRERGMECGLNFGVSLADIKTITRDFAPDHPLAKHIYPSQTRELRLAALFIADPAAVTLEELPFWATGVTTYETASNGALRFFSKSPLAGDFILTFFSTGLPLLQYCALMTAAASMMHGGSQPDWDWRQFLAFVEKEIKSHPEKFKCQLADALEAFASRLATHLPEAGGKIESLMNRVGTDI